MLHHPDLTRGPRRLEDFSEGELEAFIQRGRSLQARATGRGLAALFRTLFADRTPPVVRTERGAVDWERLLGLADERPAADAARR